MSVHEVRVKEWRIRGVEDVGADNTRLSSLQVEISRLVNMLANAVGALGRLV